MSKEITSRKEDYSQWYNDIVIKAGLADHSDVRGCMVIKPYGFAIWEKMKEILDGRFKATGHSNAYFPLFIPKSFLSREADHVEGFAKECAVVTHYRLKNDPDGKGIIVDPEARLEEELIVRPTSETIIWNTYKKWIKSYRDLPLLINQWANVVRWEMRTRLFLRTAEFNWQEGHTAHAAADEAIEEARLILNEYQRFMEDYMAIPIITGYKTESEKFAGAVDTYTTEGLMQDGRALQMGTSHFLGQNFARAFDVQFQSKEGELEHVWATSWGVSTRLMGALIMAHSDDEGLVLPPKLAPIQVVVVPIINKKSIDKKPEIDDLVAKLKEQLPDISIKYDDDDQKRPGFKFAEYEKIGVPLRVAIGPRDLENGVLEIARRDTKEKNQVPVENAAGIIKNLLEEIQQGIYDKALQFRNENTHFANSFEEFKELIAANAGFVYAHWDGTEATEKHIQETTKATIRCIPLKGDKEEGKCLVTGEPSKQRVLFAKAY